MNSEAKTNTRRWELLLPIGCLAIIAVFIAAGVFIYQGIRGALDALDGAYAVDWATETIVTHLDDHPKTWPRSWDELKPAWEKRTAGYSPRYTFAELQQQIEISFDIDPALLDSAERADVPSLVRLTNGKDHRFEGSDPTQRILDKWRGAKSLHP